MKTKKIYLIREFGGEWEDSWENIAFAFLDKESRDKKIKELNGHIEELETYRPLWEEITDKLDEIEHPEYDAFWEKYKHPMEVPDEYENYLYSDSFERFEYWMNKVLPEKYAEHTVEFWKELYTFYEDLNMQYGDYHRSHYDELEIEIADGEEFNIKRKN
jgi:hypothetical protein